MKGRQHRFQVLDILFPSNLLKTVEFLYQCTFKSFLMQNGVESGLVTDKEYKVPVAIKWELTENDAKRRYSEILQWLYRLHCNVKTDTQILNILTLRILSIPIPPARPQEKSRSPLEPNKLLQDHCQLIKPYIFSESWWYRLSKDPSDNNDNDKYTHTKTKAQDVPRRMC